MEVDSGAAPNRTFDDVRLTLYDNEESIRSVPLEEIGTFGSEASVTQSVNVTATEIPQYVVFESPDFWSEEDFPVIAFCRVDGRYEPYVVRSEVETAPARTGSLSRP